MGAAKAHDTATHDVHDLRAQTKQGLRTNPTGAKGPRRGDAQRARTKSARAQTQQGRLRANTTEAKEAHGAATRDEHDLKSADPARGQRANPLRPRKAHDAATRVGREAQTRQGCTHATSMTSKSADPARACV